MPHPDKLIIVPCGSRKIWEDRPGQGPTRADEAYTSTAFKVNLRLARHYGTAYRILSARHGFITPDTEIDNYDATFNDPKTNPVGADELRAQVRSRGLASYKTVVVLGGRRYLEAARAAFEGTGAHVAAPFAGLPLGLAARAANLCVAHFTDLGDLLAMHGIPAAHPPAGAHAPGFVYYLGTDRIPWLWSDGVRTPLMISRRALSKAVKLIRARSPWALDSGGFNELQMFGTWTVCAYTYARETLEWAEVLGMPRHAATIDWTCTTEALRATGLSVAEHQARTTGSFLELTAIAPEVPWIPVLVGLTAAELFSHVEQFYRVGVDLHKLPLVGLGGIAARQEDPEIFEVTSTLAAAGLRLHGYGLKKRGVSYLGATLASADSSAWGVSARFQKPDQTPAPCGARVHNHCLHQALSWLDGVHRTAERACRNGVRRLPARTPESFRRLNVLTSDGATFGDLLAAQGERLRVATALADAQLSPSRFIKGDLAGRARGRSGPDDTPTAEEVQDNYEIIDHAASSLAVYGQDGLRALARRHAARHAEALAA